MTLILASKSKARQEMLKNAGLKFETRPADIDEEHVQAQDLKPEEMAQRLASEKALYVSEAYPEAYVIGADQVLQCQGRILSKAKNVNEAREKLEFLKGKTHSLVSAVSVAKGGDVLWSDQQSASLTMNEFDEEALQTYISKAGDALTRSVGAYELESIGVHLFEKIEGDYFTILGMPLLALLKYLRTTNENFI